MNEKSIDRVMAEDLGGIVRAKPLSLLPGNFSTRSSMRSQMAGCSRIFPISNLKLATNHRRNVQGSWRFVI